MAFTLPSLPFPKDASLTPHISVDDENAYRTVPSSQYFKKLVGEKYLWTPVSADDPMPSSDATAQASLASILAKNDIALSALVTALLGTGSKTLTDLATVLASAATATKQDTLAGKIDTLDTVIDAILLQLGTTGIKKIIDALPAGTNLLGKVGIDQTTPGTTNKVVAELSGSITSVASAPTTGTKTVTATASEIFAGSSVKTSRRKLIIRNEDPALRMRVGPSSVNQQNGYPIEPGATLEIQFDPATAVAIYAISEGAALNAAVMEV